MDLSGPGARLHRMLDSRTRSDPTRVGFSFPLVFLLAGMLAGGDGIVGLRFDDYVRSFWVGNIALAIILLDGDGDGDGVAWRGVGTGQFRGACACSRPHHTRRSGAGAVDRSRRLAGIASPKAHLTYLRDYQRNDPRAPLVFAPNGQDWTHCHEAFEYGKPFDSQAWFRAGQQ